MKKIKEWWLIKEDHMDAARILIELIAENWEDIWDMIKIGWNKLISGSPLPLSAVSALEELKKMIDANGVDDPDVQNYASDVLSNYPRLAAKVELMVRTKQHGGN